MFESGREEPEVAYPLVERKLLHVLIVITAAGVMLGMIYVGARRFEKKERELGRWDQYGPLEETEPPPSERQGTLYGGAPRGRRSVEGQGPAAPAA